MLSLRRAVLRPKSSRLAQRCLGTISQGLQTQKAEEDKGRIIFSGIQPTGIPHLGNYLGALSNWVQLQKEANVNDKLIFSIVGWHALTLPQNPNELSQSRWEMLATLLAIGIDPKRSVMFHQDDNQCHTELAWILNCITPVGKLRRMTTWKARLADSRNANSTSEIDESMLNAGLLIYPVLQAADILAYRATHVPVGEDQTQHLELSRDIAQSFNRTFVPGKKRFFPLPTQLSTPSKRVLSLRDPTSKMSKSSPDVQSRIILTDSASQISSKIRSAVTDSIKGISYDPVQRPGVSNLLTILAACLQKEPEEVASAYASKSTGELKSDVADAVEALFNGPRAEFERLRSEKAYLVQVAKDGAERAKELSEETMMSVRSMIGLH
ncbi:tryptophanyl-tRNA synthetase [Coprinopsis marcescibilis]|uniref:Tryptophan--tRNA ligase, mitochondrial n=1 Tax=Coprinopsis marcescibilis TaxID=230819 RepID=A0A5C3LBR2_COPMA|nr:tryptophanyl-tRNA synthetase [Coprinopsis marcescibilis]